MKIYFAHSIRGKTTIPVEELRKSLSAFGEVLSEKFDYSKDISRDQSIFSSDMEMLRLADVMIAEVSNPSLGVGYEIAMAEKLGKPLLCLAQKGTLVSAMIAGNPYVKLVRYTFPGEAIDTIRVFILNISLPHSQN